MKNTLKTKRSEPTSLKFSLTLVALLSGAGAMAQDHGHLYISAYSQQAGAQLYFDNGGIFEAASGYVKTLTLNTNPASRYLGRYDGNITVTPRSTNVLRGADYGPNAAAPGSVIYFRVAHVDGPAQGALAFWENTGSQPAFSVPVGSGATNVVKVTEALGGPNDDPYGHIHGRRFTANLPGIYLVTFQALDVSTNGPAGRSTHTVSAPLTIAFQAGFMIDSVRRTNSTTVIRFGTAASHDFTLQANTNLLSSNGWVNIGGRLRGTDYFQSVPDAATTDAVRFYRVLVEPFVP